MFSFKAVTYYKLVKAPLRLLYSNYWVRGSLRRLCCTRGIVFIAHLAITVLPSSVVFEWTVHVPTMTVTIYFVYTAAQ